jgi:hypothetical protein
MCSVKHCQKCLVGYFGMWTGRHVTCVSEESAVCVVRVDEYVHCCKYFTLADTFTLYVELSKMNV